MHWKSQDEHHQPISGLMGVVDGLLSRAAVVQMLNTRMLSLPHFRRFRSVVTDSGHFQELLSFDASEVVEVFRIKTKRRGCKVVDEDSDSGSSSDSETSNESEDEYGAIQPYLSSHIVRFQCNGIWTRFEEC